jgi:DNA-binding NtrC family response regulator
MQDAGDAISILTVSAADDEILFLEHFAANSRWRFDYVRTCAEAASYLKENEVAVVLCSSELPDGNWKTLLARAGDRPNRPRVIVITGSMDDRLWSEVLECGGYDILAKPLDREEIVQVVSLAWRQWNDSRMRALRSSSRN